MSYLSHLRRTVSPYAALYAGGGVAAVGGAALTSGETDAMGIDFTYHTDRTKQMNVMTTSVGVDSDPANTLTYTSPSIKMLRQADGVWRYANHNICLQSQTIDNGNWALAKATVTANATTAPDGTSTAEKLICDNQAGAHRVDGTATIVAGIVQYQVSCFGKIADAGVQDQFTVGLSDTATHAASVNFNLSTQTFSADSLTGSATVVSKTYVSSGSGWYNVIAVIQMPSASATTGLVRVGVGFSTGAELNGLGTYVWGAQCKRYPVNDAGGFTTSTGYLATVASVRYDLPYEWDASNASQGIKTEKAATNLILRSQEIDNASWTKTAATVTADATTAPDGTTTADKVLSDGSAAGTKGAASANATTVSSSVYTLSVYIKGGLGFTWVRLASDNIDSAAGVFFNLDTGAIGTNAGITGTPTILDAGNGWYRCSITGTVTGTTCSFRLRLADADNTSNASGTSSQGAYFWGAQFELGSFPTSLIHTIAATVTRAADNITLPVASFPFSTTVGGTVFEGKMGHVSESSAFPVPWSITDGTANQRILNIIDDTAGAYKPSGLFVVDGNVTQANVNPGTSGVVTTTFKSGSAWAANDFVNVMDGGTPSTDGAGTVPTGLTTLRFGEHYSVPSLPYTGYIRKFTYLKRRATNGQLQTLTT